MALVPGTRCGSYEIVSVVGAGGMGEVYRARDDRLHRFVALKFLPATMEQDPAARQQLLHEARAAAALDHPFICKVHEVGEAGGRTFIAMEYVGGETLKARLARGPLAPGELLAIAIEIAEALENAHARAIVHRDLKPSNVMLDEHRHVKILDFGVAARIQTGAAGDQITTRSAAREASTTMGTLAYMAPEQLRGLPADARSDLFSFGVMLYEMWTGVAPFQRPAPFETAHAILGDAPPPWPARRVPPVLLQHIVRKALAKDPADRYQSVHEMLTDLRAVSVDADTARPARLVAVPASRPGSRRVWTALTVAAALALVGTAIVWRTRWTREPARVEPTHRQITFVGNVIDGALSRDGRTVAYITDDRDGRRLMVQDIAGGPAIEVARDAGLRLLQWSPDGSQLAFYADAAMKVVSRFGGPSRRLARAAYFAWSPDGSRIAAANQDTRGCRIVGVATGDELGAVSLGNTGSLHGLDWDHASNRLAFIERGQTGSWAIWIASPDGKQIRNVYSDTNAIMAARWASQPDTLYALRTRNDATEIVRIVLGSGGDAAADVLLSGLSAEGSLGLSADGRRLLHVRVQRRSNLEVIDLARPDAAPRPLTSGTGFFAEPRVSPDARWIVAQSGRGARSRIVKIPFAGGPAIPLTGGDHVDANPEWSPDGKRIAFGSNRSGTPGVWTMTDEGRQQADLRAAGVSTNLVVAWTPDGRIAWQQTTPGSRLHYRVRDIATGREEWLTTDPRSGWMLRAEFSPAGDRVAVLWNRNDSRQGIGLWMLSWPPGSERFLKLSVSPFGWSPDGRTIYATSTLASERHVWAVSAETGASRVVASIPSGAIDSCDVTPDGSAIVCSIEQRTADAWLVENFDPNALR